MYYIILNGEKDIYFKAWKPWANHSWIEIIFNST